jgi:hypothetical protein
LGGVVNLVSRRPEDAPVRELLLNQTTRGGTDGVVFLSAPTYLDSEHLVLPAGYTEIADYFGKKSASALAKSAAQKKARAASPAWRATHRSGGLKTSASTAEHNATMPLLGLYPGLGNGSKSSSYTFPVEDPHSAVFGLLMQEALDAYAQENQDPQAKWADFTLVGVVEESEGLAADAVVAWLQERAGLP